ncbi:MAG TPA: tetratricopeptide repeat protein [Candidatus Merdisoma merdipullorum]|nr:tetratricopeptide repeat protein [Candidatus Merdisoma merdipullorum]
MMRKLKWLLCLMVLMVFLPACGKSTAEKWQEQYDLGMKYLEEGDYEEAIVVFTAAIELAPKQAELYLGLAETYIVQGDFETAREILQEGYDATGDESLKARIEELDSGTISDYWGNTLRMSHYDENGQLLWYHQWDYNAQHIQQGITCYDASGTPVAHIDYEYDEAGRQIVDNGGYDFSNGIFSRVEYRYDDSDRIMERIDFDVLTGEKIGSYAYTYDGEGEECIQTDEYDAEGNLQSYSIYEYDGEGNTVRQTAYKPDGEIDFDWYYQYDEAGNRVYYEAFDGNGNLYDVAEWEYDEDGTLIRATWYDGEGNKTSETIFN